MVVVPENFISNMQHQQNLQTSPLTQKLSSLDSDMDKILRNKELSDDIKLQQYQQTLQRYLNFYGQRKEQPLQIKVESNSKESVEDDQDESPRDDLFNEIHQEVMDTVPKTTRSRARLSLNKMKKNKDVMYWNERGELLYHGKVIPSTHIADLVRDAVKGRKSFDPNGWQFFARGLAKINTPHDWIGNDQRKDVMKEYKARLDEGDEDPVRLLPTPSPKAPTESQRTPKRRKTVISRASRGRWISY